MGGVGTYPGVDPKSLSSSGASLGSFDIRSTALDDPRSPTSVASAGITPRFRPALTPATTIPPRIRIAFRRINLTAFLSDKS